MVEKIVVIGSNCFTGAHFVNELLNQGHEVTGISRSRELAPVFLPYRWNGQATDKFTFYQQDLNRDLDKIVEIIHDIKPDYIVNFAAQGMVAESWSTPEQWLLTNMLSAVKLHQHLKDCGFLRKFVQISTPEVYGSCEGDVKENVNYNPSTPYAVSKAAVDMSLMTFFRQYKFPVVFTRSANVYGPGQQLYRVIPKAAISFMTGARFELHGGGRSVRSFIHIKDVVKGTLKAMRSGKPGSIFHFSTGRAVTIRSLVKQVAQGLNVIFQDCVLDVEDRPGKDKAYLLDCTWTKKQLDWIPQVGMDDGIRQTLSWIETNFETLKKEPFEYIHKP